MDHPTRSALHLERVKIGLVGGIQGTKVSDTAVLSTTNLGSKISIPCEVCCQGQRQHGSQILFDRLYALITRKLTMSPSVVTRDPALFLGFGRSVFIYNVRAGAKGTTVPYEKESHASNR